MIFGTENNVSAELHYFGSFPVATQTAVLNSYSPAEIEEHIRDGGSISELLEAACN